MVLIHGLLLLSRAKRLFYFVSVFFFFLGYPILIYGLEGEAHGDDPMY